MYGYVFIVICLKVFFKISPLISSLNHWGFSGIFFSLREIFFFFLFLWLISDSMPLWSEKVLEINSILLKLLSLFWWPNMWLILENVPWALEKNVYSWLFFFFFFLCFMIWKFFFKLTFLFFYLSFCFFFLFFFINFFSCFFFFFFFLDVMSWKYSLSLTVLLYHLRSLLPYWFSV